MKYFYKHGNKSLYEKCPIVYGTHENGIKRNTKIGSAYCAYYCEHIVYYDENEKYIICKELTKLYRTNKLNRILNKV